MTETKAVVDCISHGVPSYIAILGGPGIGKTTLALVALYAPEVAARFGTRRYFVPCDAASNGVDILGIVCAVFSIVEPTQAAAKRRLSAVLQPSPAVIVLDNFESAWEAPSTRPAAEELLAFLADIVSLSIVLTLRGTERPGAVAWTAPLLAPLQPLNDDAAWQVVAGISDLDDQSEHMDYLLRCVDNVPLGLVLMANLLQFEAPADIRSRWNSLKTSMLTRGSDRLSSLDVSIGLSVESPRMRAVPVTRTVLAILALLPRGAYDSDILLWMAESSLASRAVSILLACALAFRTSERRVQVLAPIREFVLSGLPLSHDHALPVYNHYFQLAEILTQETEMGLSDEALKSASAEIDNIYALIRFALPQEQLRRSAVKAAHLMMRFLNRVGIGSFDLLHEALDVARAAHLDDLTAGLLVEWANRETITMSHQQGPLRLLDEALAIYSASNDVRNVIYVTCMRAGSTLR